MSISCWGPRPIIACPRWWRAPRAAPAPQLDTDFPVESKFDHLPEATGEAGVTAFLSVQEGCDKFCTLLRRALYPRGRGLAPGGGRAGRGAKAWSAAARARSRCWARTSTPITARARRRGLGPGAADRRAGADPRSAAHPLHHLPSRRYGRGADRRPWRGAEADALPASAGAVGLGSHPGGDEPRAIARRDYRRIDRAPAPGAARPRALHPISSSAFPARAKRISPRRLALIERGRLRRRLLLQIQPAPRHAGGGVRGSGARAGEGRTPGAAPGAARAPERGPSTKR